MTSSDFPLMKSKIAVPEWAWITCTECGGEGHFVSGPGMVRCAECGGAGGFERSAPLHMYLALKAIANATHSGQAMDYAKVVLLELEPRAA